MTQSFFEVEKGIELDGAVFLSGTGAAGGTTDTDSVGVGSYYLRTDASGGIYHKKTAGSGTDKWEKMGSEDFVLANSGSNSWREPVLVNDTTIYADITAAQDDADAGDTVDGVAIVGGERILFPNLTSGNENVYIVSGSTGSWTFTEDSNLASDGDTVYIQDGTEAGKAYSYNGTDWVLSNQTSVDELGFLRAFVGKTGPGVESPTYSSNVYVSGNLEVAIGALDAQVSTNATDISTLQSDLLDARTEAIQTNITTLTVLDSMLVDEVAAVKWSVIAEGFLEANAANKQGVEIFATHDGHVNGSGLDASDTDYTIYSKLKMGSIGGLTFNVDVSGSGGSQVMQLTVVSTLQATVRSVREVITFA